MRGCGRDGGWRVGSAFGAAAVLLSAITACGDGDGSTRETRVAGARGGATTVSVEATTGSRSCTPEHSGGKLTAMTGAPLSGLDPTVLQGSGARGGDAAAAFYGTVIRYDATTDTYHPSIAESWESNDDNSVWTLVLRDDVTFGNGSAFTTHDVAAHLERMAAAPVSAAGMAALVADVEIVDDHEMVVTLESPFDFRYMMATEPGWVPDDEVVEQRGEAFHADPTGAGAGAFEFRSMSTTPGESLVLQRKDDWWGGSACLDEIDFRYAENVDTQTDAFLNGEVDTLFVSEQVQAVKLDNSGLLVYEIPVGTSGYVTTNQGFDGEETKFDDVRVREAMQLAVNYDVLYERLFDGRGPAPTSAIMPENSSLHPGVEGPPYDPERARQLVQATIDEGVWDASFTYTFTPLEAQTELAVALEGMWEAVGMDVTLDPAEDALTRVIVDQRFEVASLGFGAVPPQPWRHLSGLECGSTRTRSGFCDPDIDAALNALKEAVTSGSKRDAMAQLQRVWNETFPLVVYRHNTFGYAAQPHVHGLEFGTNYTPRFERAWVEQ